MSTESLNNNTEKEQHSPYSKWQKAMEDVEYQGKSEKSKQYKTRKDINETIRSINQKEINRSDKYSIRPKDEIICSGDSIVDQRIEVINKSDKGKIEFDLKIEVPTKEIIGIEEQLDGSNSRAVIETPDGLKLRRGEIDYTSIEGHGGCKLCDAFILEKEGARISIADTRVTKVRSATGLIRIELPASMNPDDMTKSLSNILEKDLGISDALSEVSEESEKEHKVTRYEWHHKTSDELTPKQEAEAERMHRKEVFPGYTTFVEEGKHKEYLDKYGDDMRAVHMISTDTKLHTDKLYQILTNGLMSTTERYDRGIMSDGRSSLSDLVSGGANSVFTTLTSKIQREFKISPLIVFKPELFDRTDWYSYQDDQFGSTKDQDFDERLSPDELFATRDTSGYFPTHNEQMFRTGIGVDYIESVQVDSYYEREKVVQDLKTMGLTEVGGRPIEEIIVSKFGDPTMEDIMEYANDSTDHYRVAKSKIEAEIARGRKEELKKDAADYLKKTVDIDELKRIAKGGIMYRLKTEQKDKDFYLYLKETLGIDYQEIYKDMLKSRKK